MHSAAAHRWCLNSKTKKESCTHKNTSTFGSLMGWSNWQQQEWHIQSRRVQMGGLKPFELTVNLVRKIFNLRYSSPNFHSSTTGFVQVLSRQSPTHQPLGCWPIDMINGCQGGGHILTIPRASKWQKMKPSTMKIRTKASHLYKMSPSKSLMFNSEIVDLYFIFRATSWPCERLGLWYEKRQHKINATHVEICMWHRPAK